MKTTHTLGFSLLLACVAVPAQSKPALPSTPVTASPVDSGSPAPGYHLHRSDRLELQFPFSPEYNESVSVQPDGRITLRELEPLQVAGHTIPEAQTLIEQAYASVLKEPRVSISLRDFQVPSFYASGEVGRPGRYELHTEITLLQAISEAGGMLNERARKKEIVLFRPQGNGTYESHVIDVKKMVQAKGVHEDVAIAPGDIIYVPQNRSSKVQRYLPSTNIGTYVAPSVF